LPRPECRGRTFEPELMFLEILHFAFVLLCLFHCLKRAQIAPLAGGCVLLSRIQSILA
jgi:hypothetical protein